MKNRHETNLDQLRALLEVWRQCGFDDAYRLVLAAEKMLHEERGFYEGFERKPIPDKPPLRVRFAFWLLQRQRVDCSRDENMEAESREGYYTAMELND